jgi:serine/threonine protein kinase/tetratricopeptide (TPR) repeat protein
MGEVYLAEDTRLHRRVAIKRIRPELASNAALRQRLLTEARAAARLDHPNICAIHEAGEDEHGPFIVMAFIEGEPLDTRLARGLLPIDTTLELASQIVDAVCAAHEHGILHRDLKPANVHLDNRGQARVMDFGLAKITDAGESDSGETRFNLTTTGVPIGTTAYMSPEQARGEHVDARSDVFSLGVIFYEMITGHRPFPGANPADTVTSILTHTPPPVTRARPEAPDDLQRIVSKALRKDRDERYQTARDMLADLRTLRREVVSGSMRIADESSAAKQRLRPWVVAVAVILAVTAIGYLQLRPGRGSIATSPRITSLAVLPLANVSGDPEQEFFANGMTDALITELARVKELRVISRSSSMRFKGQQKAMSDLARELQVDGIVDGSVTRVGNQVRISAELIHAPSDRHVWADSYEGDLGEVLSLQRRVAQDIARQVQVTVSPTERKALASGRSVDPRAQEHYLRGREAFQSAISTPRLRYEDLMGAIREYEAAIAIEPNWATAYAAVAEAKHWMAPIDPDRLFNESRDAARKAISLDDELADAHGALAYVSSAYFWDWALAEREYRRAIGLNPGITYNGGFAMMLSALGRHDEAAEAYTVARARDPLATVLRINFAWSRIFARQYEASEREARQMIDSGLDVRGVLAWALAWQGRADEAVTIFKTLAAETAGVLPGTTSPSSMDVLSWLISGLAMAGKHDEARALLPDLERSSDSPIGARALARASAHLGDRGRAIAALERAYTAPPQWLANINVDPSFDVLRDDPKFQDLLRQMRLRN